MQCRKQKQEPTWPSHACCTHKALVPQCVVAVVPAWCLVVVQHLVEMEDEAGHKEGCHIW